jgi:hypothetical protein
MQVMELTTIWRTVMRWLEIRMGRTPRPCARAIIAVALGCALLTMHTLSASAAMIDGGAANRLNDPVLAIGAVTISQDHTDDLGSYTDFAFDTSVDTTVVLALSTEAPTSADYYCEFAQVDAAAMQAVPSQAHGIRIASLRTNTTYHYALIAVTDAQHQTRIEGTFKTSN